VTVWYWTCPRVLLVACPALPIVPRLVYDDIPGFLYSWLAWRKVLHACSEVSICLGSLNHPVGSDSCTLSRALFFCLSSYFVLSQSLPVVRLGSYIFFQSLPIPIPLHTRTNPDLSPLHHMYMLMTHWQAQTISVAVLRSLMWNLQVKIMFKSWVFDNAMLYAEFLPIAEALAAWIYHGNQLSNQLRSAPWMTASIRKQKPLTVTLTSRQLFPIPTILQYTFRFSVGGYKEWVKFESCTRTTCSHKLECSRRPRRSWYHSDMIAPQIELVLHWQN